jgi:tetratricopeptide (TPR) repeat protein
MPKPIKRRRPKRPKTEVQEIQSLYGRLLFFWQRHHRRLLLALAVLLLVLAVGLGGLYWQHSTDRKAQRLAYEGYKLYHNLYLAEPLTAQERYQRALKAFQEAQALRPSAYNLYYIGACLAELGRLQEAAETLQRLLREYPQEPYLGQLARLKLAQVASRQGRTEEALGHLRELSARRGSFADLALLQEARLLQEMGKTQEALKKYRSLLQGFVNSPYAEEARQALETLEK